MFPTAPLHHANRGQLFRFTPALHVGARADSTQVTTLISGGVRTPFLSDRFSEIDMGPSRLPTETVVQAVAVVPMRETSWP